MKRFRIRQIEACHEGGHVVAARHLGLFVEEAFYDPKAKHFSRPGYVKWQAFGVLDAPVLAAGHVAALRQAGRKDSSILRTQAIDDRSMLRSLLADYLSPEQFEAYELKLEDDIAHFLYRPEVWEIVTDFAERLVNGGSLNAEECMRLTKKLPVASWSDIKRMMLDPSFHNHMERRIGRTRRSTLERRLDEAVKRLPAAFEFHPMPYPLSPRLNALRNHEKLATEPGR